MPELGLSEAMSGYQQVDLLSAAATSNLLIYLGCFGRGLEELIFRESSFKRLRLGLRRPRQLVLRLLLRRHG
jgi:hypothetical protein